MDAGSHSRSLSRLQISGLSQRPLLCGASISTLPPNTCGDGPATCRQEAQTDSCEGPCKPFGLSLPLPAPRMAVPTTPFSFITPKIWSSMMTLRLATKGCCCDLSLGCLPWQVLGQSILGWPHETYQLWPSPFLLIRELGPYRFLCHSAVHKWRQASCCSVQSLLTL